jgi:hypothetical protein
MNLLSQIDALKSKLRLTALKDETDIWWDDFRAIKSHVEQHGGAANRVANSENLHRVNRALSDLIAAIRDGLPSPNLSAAIRSLDALKTTYSKGAVGVDGWPIK